LGTEQYLTGTIVTDYDGAILSLPSFDPRLAQYHQIASFTGPEEATTTREVEVPEGSNSILPADPLRQNLDRVQRVVEGVGGQVVVLKWFNPVYWGFVLTSPGGSIISFRGTQRTNEWVQNALAQQIFYTDLSPFKFEGQVHRGFATLYGSIAEQVVDIARQLDKTRPIYITGHSLGASLAMLAGMDLALRVPELSKQLQVYTYAGPRVGDVAFAEAHSRLVPNTYRVVNLADAIPMAPPTETGKLIFTHPGQLWGFLYYSGDAIPGHFVSVYRTAIDKNQEALQS
jgi:predicted lipase